MSKRFEARLWRTDPRANGEIGPRKVEGSKHLFFFSSTFARYRVRGIGRCNMFDLRFPLFTRLHNVYALPVINDSIERVQRTVSVDFYVLTDQKIDFLFNTVFHHSIYSLSSRSFDAFKINLFEDSDTYRFLIYYFVRSRSIYKTFFIRTQVFIYERVNETRL